LLGWNPRDFAREAKVDLSTVYRIEASGHSSARGRGRTLEKLITTLGKRGVEFIENGVRLTRKPRR